MAYLIGRIGPPKKQKNPRKLHTFPTTGWLAITAGTVSDVCSKTNVYVATEFRKEKKNIYIFCKTSQISNEKKKKKKKKKKITGEADEVLSLIHILDLCIIEMEQNHLKTIKEQQKKKKKKGVRVQMGTGIKQRRSQLICLPG